jgi:hypothetical protein
MKKEGGCFARREKKKVKSRFARERGCFIPPPPYPPGGEEGGVEVRGAGSLERRTKKRLEVYAPLVTWRLFFVFFLFF